MERVLDWVEFTQADPRVLAFGPDGLMTDRRMYPESSAAFIQRLAMHASLPNQVPQQVREYFAGARHAFVRGFFSYELFAVSAAIGALAEEFALGERFIDYFQNRLTLVGRDGETVHVEVERFGLLVEIVRPTGPHPLKSWRIREAPGFSPMLGWLIKWAHERGLLTAWLNPGWQRAKPTMRSMVMTNQLPQFTPPTWSDWTQDARDAWFEANARGRWEQDQVDTVRELRNALAHPTFAIVQDPISAAALLQTNAEFISSLWSGTQS